MTGLTAQEIEELERLVKFLRQRDWVPCINEAAKAIEALLAMVMRQDDEIKRLRAPSLDGMALTDIAMKARDFISQCDGTIRVADFMRQVNSEGDATKRKHVYNAFSYLARRNAIRRVGYGEYVRNG
ncbi:MAG TPA: hypothetical protein VM639_24530 [Dongiaceae bacterium]|nr:hypothetical protein [Dongiaceae bacterium]